MKTIYIYCEGTTEESFINTVLYPYFFDLGIYVRPIVKQGEMPTGSIVVV